MTTPNNEPDERPAPNSLEYAKPEAPRKSDWQMWLFVTALVAVLAVLGMSALLPSLNGPRAMSNRVRCASNLRQIGQAIQMYANENNHQFPPDLKAVLATQDVTPDVFVCPESNDTAATGPTTQAVLADFAIPGHCSYQYFGAGMRDTDDPRIVVASESLGDHAGAGANVLFIDGHVEFFPPLDVQKITAAATTQPTIWPPPSGP
jgi:prepilin-type processing-associated H-X9-DG protein